MKKRMIVAESALVLGLVLALSITATHTNENTGAISSVNSSASASAQDGITAGVAGTFQNIELLTAEELESLVTIDAGDSEHVAAMLDDDFTNVESDVETESQTQETEGQTQEIESQTQEIESQTQETESQTQETEGIETMESSEPVIIPEEEAAAVEDESVESTIAENRPKALTEEELEWIFYLMPDVKNSLNVRNSAEEDADIVGKLRKGDRAVIVEQGDEWTKISSGNVEGYVKNELCIFGLEALAYAKENCDMVATSTINGLRVRKEASLDGSVAKKLDNGEKLTVDTKAEPVEGWVAVLYNDTTCFVSADYVEVSLKTGKAVTLEEAAAAEEAKKIEKSYSKSSKKPCALASEVDEVTLLAGIIECEAGGQDYEALLAVGAVVMNRVNSSHYPDTIYGVIHQKGQFPPATSGKLEKWLKKGPTKKAIKAAKAAMAGEDNTGGLMSFNCVTTGREGLVIGDNVFY